MARQEQRMSRKIKTELLPNINHRASEYYLYERAKFYGKSENNLRDRRATIRHSDINLIDTSKGEERQKRTDSILKRNNTSKHTSGE